MTETRERPAPTSILDDSPRAHPLWSLVLVLGEIAGRVGQSAAADSTRVTGPEEHVRDDVVVEGSGAGSGAMAPPERGGRSKGVLAHDSAG